MLFVSVQVTTEEQRSSFVSALSAAEDWLYEEGDAEEAKVFREKLSGLRKTGDPMTQRALVGGVGGWACVCVCVCVEIRLCLCVNLPLRVWYCV